MGRMEQMLRSLRDEKGSDLHLAAGQTPRMRRKGSLDPIAGEARLDDSGLRSLLREIASDEQWTSYETQSDLDFAYGIPGVARFRANYFMQKNGVGAVFREIPSTIMTAEQLELPAVISKLAMLPRGLVLVTGPTGSGKTTTLASMIDVINKERDCHIITI